MSQPTKYCKDCKHSFIPPGSALYRCALKTKIEYVSPVDGTVKYTERLCDWEREGDWLSARIYRICGNEGRFWEPKP